MHLLTTMFAEIADKMPTLEALSTVWLVIGLVAALVTVALSLARLWIGSLAVIATVALGLLAWSDTSMDEAIVRELGDGYLPYQRLSAFIPSILALSGWMMVWLFRRPNKSAAANVRPALG